MHDVLDIIRNVQSLYAVGPTLTILKDFERVLDELDVYVFQNWEDGELLSGPVDSRHFVTCSFMWPADKMPDPSGGKRLLDRGCKVTYAKDELLKPREIKSPEDYRPGTTKGKIDGHDIWVVEIKMPKELIGNFKHGKDTRTTKHSLHYRISGKIIDGKRKPNVFLVWSWGLPNPAGPSRQLPPPAGSRRAGEQGQESKET